MLLEENRFENIDCLGEKGQTPLHEAASKSHYEIVKILVDKGANINAKSDDESTPLHNVSNQSDENALKIAKLLIEGLMSMLKLKMEGLLSIIFLRSLEKMP